MDMLRGEGSASAEERGAALRWSRMIMETDMAAKLQLPPSRSKARSIDGAQFRYGLNEAGLTPERFATLFCNGRVSRVHEWLNDELPAPPWVPALLAAMGSPEGRTRAIATAEHLLAANAPSA